MFEGDDVDTAPSLVVDCFVELAGKTRGMRPFRTVVGFDFGVVGPMNAMAESSCSQLYEAMGLTDVVTLKPS